MRSAMLLLSILLGFGLLATSAQADPAIKAKLTGEDSNAKGQFKIKFNLNKGEGKFRLKVNKAKAVTSAHLHCQDGDVVAVIFGEIPGGFDVNGKLSQFRLTDANLEAVSETCDGEIIDTLEALVAAIDAGLITVDLHTVAFPDGEIRGTL